MYILSHSETLVARLFTAALLLAGVGSAFATTHYVDLNSTNATPPYTNWVTAATNIQDAVDAAVAGDDIVVTNGIYGGVGVGKPLSVRSVNGPQFTTIFGGASLTNGDTLSGFTLTHGGPPGFIAGVNARGVWCGRRSSAVVSNCVITGNFAFASRDAYGGGAYGGTLNNCILTDNYVQDFSAYAYGGGAYGCTLNNCVLSGNSAGFAVSSTSITSGFGGGAVGCTLNNCILTRNSASSSDSIFEDKGGGAYQCTLRNCMLSDNWVFDHWFGQYESDYSQSTLIECWFGDPLFVDYVGGNLRLQASSPCINAGNNAFAPAGPDLDGNPRIVGGTVDIGAYEYQSLSLLNFSVISNQAAFSITGQSNQVVTVEASTDLSNWSPLATNTLNGHPFPFNDPTPAILSQRFYRAQPQ
jgi:hypothetical protein